MAFYFLLRALKDLFGAKSELLNNFCNITSTASCSSVMESKKWKIFSLVDLSSLSIVFFATQLVSFFLFLLSNSANEYFYIQKILLFGAVPVTLLSVYYQKFVEKNGVQFVCQSVPF
ncbi:vitamin K epoxide reductase family protein [Flavobacterium sp. P21]|uniref:vitamin K epoxide reductase family protein n=1 Tax=Flavobacterium sp. P21 TaxID=3423948 RepID=UPI003D66BBF5